MATQLNIKDPATIGLAREVARRRGSSVTAAVRDALQAAKDRLEPEPQPPLTADQQNVYDTIMAIVAETAPKLRAAGVTMENYDEGMYDYLYKDDFAG